MNEDLVVSKVLPESVPYGTNIARGPHVWVVCRGPKLLGVYATAKEARRKHHIWPQRSKEYQRMMTQRRYNPGGKKGTGGGQNDGG